MNILNEEITQQELDDTFAEQTEVEDYESEILLHLFPNFAEKYIDYSKKSLSLYYMDNFILNPYLKKLNEKVKDHFDWVDYITYSVFNNGFAIYVIPQSDFINNLKQKGFGDNLGEYMGEYLGLPYEGYFLNFHRLIYKYMSNSDKYKELLLKIINKLKIKIDNIPIGYKNPKLWEKAKENIKRGLY